MSLWFALLGLGLAPVMVGATEVIVGNAPIEHAGVAGGLQQAAMQVGGSLGTAVLGAVMASKVDSVLPEKWAEAKLPPLTPGQEDKLKSAAEVGVAPPAPKGTPEQIAAEIKGVVHDTFISGMGARLHRAPASSRSSPRASPSSPSAVRTTRDRLRTCDGAAAASANERRDSETGRRRLCRA